MTPSQEICYVAIIIEAGGGVSRRSYNILREKNVSSDTNRCKKKEFESALTSLSDEYWHG
jgi:hypothetical protein